MLDDVESVTFISNSRMIGVHDDERRSRLVDHSFFICLSVTEETFFVDATRGSIVQFGKVDLLERGEAIAVVLVVVIVFDVAMEDRL